MKEVIIFGTGKLGEIAYKYYCNRYGISCFVDNNKDKWNTLFFNIPIYNPEILREKKDVMVIVPDGIYKDIMCEQLYSYGVKAVLLFRLSEKIYTPYTQAEIISKEDEFIINYMGGLGNQLFQYAFMRYLMIIHKKKCSADLSMYIYPYMMEYTLQEVFPKVKIRKCNSCAREEYISDKTLCYYEPKSVKSMYDSFKDFNIGEKSHGYLLGYFQSCIFVESIKKEIYKELEFFNVEDEGIKKYMKLFKNKDTVSIHIRRGDYIKKEVDLVFGGICDREYYLKAMDYLKEILKNPTFVFFSNDIEWVKNNYFFENAIYIESKEFDNYHDWYDMYLMSNCKNNIIANSTFSWWGAWLNFNKEKIVIAPKKWNNREDKLDICPKEWIRI